jgi:hypothetical protein
MNCAKIAKRLAIFPAIFVLLALAPAFGSHGGPMPPDHPIARAYLAQINATGEMTLKNFTGNLFNVTIDVSFNAMVPNATKPGEYSNAEFHGYAVAEGEHRNSPAVLRFDGLMTVDGSNFFTVFAVSKPSGISDGWYNANGDLDLNITEIVPNPTQVTMVSMKGSVEKLGDQNASGFLEADARIGGVNNFTDVHTTFTLEPPPRSDQQSGNFSRTFYSVRLTNMTMTEVDFEGNAFYVNGLWTVENKTITVTHYDHDSSFVINTHVLLEEAPGEFNVTLAPQITSNIMDARWKTNGNFTLDIQGMTGMIEGNVIFYHTKVATMYERDIPKCDFNQDNVVNIMDVSRVARAFGAKFGMPQYDSEVDSNQDFAINILDISNVAREFSQEY